MRTITAAAAAAVLLAGPGLALAEDADRSQPIEIVANHFAGDEIRQVAVYTGAAEVHQGTLEILGDKLTLVISPDGYRRLTVTGNPARMKERRDADPKKPGVEEWMHASALTAVYDEKEDRIILTTRAKIARSENGLVKDSTAGQKIIYDLRNARSYVEGEVVDGKRARVSSVFAPRDKEGSAKKKSSSSSSRVPLTSSTRLDIKE